jgi:tetratricopeptide (TPR) repeat protein
LQLIDSEAGSLNAEGWMLAHFGYPKQATEAVNAALAISHGFLTKVFAAGDLAFAGENAKALAVVSEASKARPNDTLVQIVAVPFVQAVVALNGGNAGKAIDLLKPALPYDKGNTADIYVRGLAYLKMGQGNEAAQEFQKLLALRNFAPTDPLMSLAHLGLGRAYALAGDTARSRAAYQDFFALWKDADPDVPLLKQAKNEYAKPQ